MFKTFLFTPFHFYSLKDMTHALLPTSSKQHPFQKESTSIRFKKSSFFNLPGHAITLPWHGFYGSKHSNVFDYGGNWKGAQIPKQTTY